MDALSATPVSTLKSTTTPSASTNPIDHINLAAGLLKSPTSRFASSSSSLSNTYHLSAAATGTRSRLRPPQSPLSNKQQQQHYFHLRSPRHVLRHPPPSTPSPSRRRALFAASPQVVYGRRASTGYAAALLDVSRCESATGAMARDVRRFMRGVRRLLADSTVDEAKKGRVVEGVAEGGGFAKHLVSLVKALVRKKKVALVGEVMDEFERIADELSGTRAVAVASSSGEKMEKKEMKGIAKEVQKMGRAARVKVKHFFEFKSASHDHHVRAAAAVDSS